MPGFTAKVIHGFTPIDYGVFVGMLVIAAFIGIFYAVKDRKNTNIENYNYGGRNMSPIALGLSISVTFLSALTMIGFPSETYVYGSVAIWNCLGPIIPMFIACLYYIPLIHNLKLTTVFEYFELRYDKQVRKFVSLLSMIKQVTYMGITVYLPALALNAVTSLSLNASIALTTVICTFYTSLGGIKAVVWTDTLQALIMLIGGLSAMVKAVIVVGGFGKMWEAMERGERINTWELNMDPTLQRTFWTIFIGYSFNRSQVICCGQETSQRFLSCKSTKYARIAALVSILPSVVLTGIAVLTGCAAFAYFENCDPIKNGQIQKPDQLVPFMASEIFQNAPGMTGLFVSAAYCGTLSTVSSGINSVGALILEDFIIPVKPNLSQFAKVTVGKIIALSLGLFVAGIAFLCQVTQGTIIAVSASFNGSIGGPILGIFTLSLFFPWANKKGALTGFIVAITITLWITVSSTIYGKPPDKVRALPTSVESCVSANNETMTSILHDNSSFDWFTTDYPATITEATSSPDADKPFFYYNIWAVSFWYYNPIGFLTCIIVGLAVSFATGATKPSLMDSRLFVPFIDNKLLPENIRHFFRFGVPNKQSKKDIYNIDNNNKNRIEDEKKYSNSLLSHSNRDENEKF